MHALMPQMQQRRIATCCAVALYPMLEFSSAKASSTDILEVELAQEVLSCLSELLLRHCWNERDVKAFCTSIVAAVFDALVQSHIVLTYLLLV